MQTLNPSNTSVLQPFKKGIGVKVHTLKKRRQFLAVSGKKWVCPAFILQKGEAGQGETCPHFGFVVTRRMGGAVVRNRIRRRLREAIGACLDGQKLGVQLGHYVCIARKEAHQMPFSDLLHLFQKGFAFLGRH